MLLLIMKLKKEVIIESDNDVWTMTVTTEENGVNGATKKSEFISGTKDKVMSEADKRGIAAMGQINKK